MKVDADLIKLILAFTDLCPILRASNFKRIHLCQAMKFIVTLRKFQKV